jgi:hypothetical protein
LPPARGHEDGEGIEERSRLDHHATFSHIGARQHSPNHLESRRAALTT